tara:strand:- start:986 stop:1276 length:291 start_codon:yes stop_codon:yes gene_type:complete
MKAYKALIKYALAQKCTVSVYDGEEWAVKRSLSYKEINDAVESVEEAVLRIRNDNDDIVAHSVTVSAFGLEDDETIIDYSISPFMELFEVVDAMKL